MSAAPAVTVPETAAGLPAALAELPDPRARRGVRHRLTVVVTAAVCAVMAGYRSFTAIAEWIADVPTATAVALGIAPDRRPSEAMIRRLLQAVDPNLLTSAVSGWLTSRTIATPAGGRRAIAVDGKTLRGSRTTDTLAQHVLAACDQANDGQDQDLQRGPQQVLQGFIFCRLMQAGAHSSSVPRSEARRGTLTTTLARRFFRWLCR